MSSAPSAPNDENSESSRQQLRDIVHRDESSLQERIARLLRVGADRFGVELGLLVEVDPEGSTYTIDEVSEAHPDLTRGLTGDLLSTYCRMVVAEEEPLVVENAPEQGWADDPAYRTTLLSTYIGTAVEVEGSPYGTVCFVDAEPRAGAFDEEDRSFLGRLAEAVGTLVEQRDGDPDGPEAAQAMSAVERRYRTALKHSPVTFATVDQDLRYEWICNPHEDFDPAAVIGKRDDELDSGPGIDQLMELKQRVLDQGEQCRQEIVFDRSDGVQVYDVTATPLREGRGAEVTGVVTASLNVTDQKEKERQLEESEARYRALVENFPDGAVGIYDPDLTYTLVEGTLVGEALPDADDFEGTRMPALFPDATVADLEPLFRAAVEEGTTDHVETQFNDRTWRVWATPLRDHEGAIFGGLSFAQDITEQREREARLRDLSNSIPGVVFQVFNRPDDPHEDHFVSEHAAEVLGIAPDPATFYERFLEHVPDAYRAKLRASVEAAVENEEPWKFETPFDPPSGERRWILGRSTPRRQGDDVVFSGVLLDITERKKSERALRRSRERLSMATEGGNIGTWNWDLKTDEVVFNQQWAEMLGYSQEELDFHFSTWMELVHPDDLSRAMDVLNAYIDGECDTYAPEMRMRTKAGDWKWIQAIGQVVDRDDDGDVVRVAGIHLDIDDRKQYEEQLRRAKEEAEEAAQLKSVMLANMSHEVRTPLTSMIGFSGILKGQLDGHSAKLARLIHKSGQRLEETLEAVLELSQLEAGSYAIEREPVDVVFLARRIVDEFEPQSEENGVAVEVTGDEDTGPAYADETAVRRIISNLLDNAIKFTPDGGRVTIRIRPDGADWVMLAVEDTGVGIAEEALPRVFEAFKQESEGLTREYEGAGLGLSIVNKLVKALGGEVEVETEKDEGTCFFVRLPRATEE
jgi:PAS domain S-box-containing protein